MKDALDTQTLDFLADLSLLTPSWDRAQAGMHEAADHAERVAPGWAERALSHVAAYVAEHPGKSFVTPEVRAEAEAQGLDPAASNLAWGNVMKRAREQGLVRPVGYAQRGNAEINVRPMRLWQARGAGAESSLADQVRRGFLSLESALDQARHEGYAQGRAARLRDSGDSRD